MKFLSYDGPFNQFVIKVVDCFFIGLLWILASIPIITSGAATVALYYSVNKVVRQEEGKVWRCFWRAFFRDFWQATGIWMILLVFYTASLASYSAMIGMGLDGFPKGLLIAVVLVVTLWTQYWYPYLSRFEDKTKNLLQNTLIMLLSDFFRSVKMLLLLLACLVIAFFALLYAPALLILLPGFYVFIGNRTVDKVFGRYISEPEADAEAEEEETEEEDE